MRLIDQLAAEQIYYHRPLPTLPDILLIDIPPGFSGGGLALDRYYLVILETLAKMHEFEAFLCERRPELIPPSPLDRRPSGLRTDNIVFARYHPPAPGRPWLPLCYWPRHYTLMVPDPGGTFACGAYTIDAFADAEAVDAAELRLLANMGPHEGPCRSIPAVAGHAWSRRAALNGFRSIFCTSCPIRRGRDRSARPWCAGPRQDDGDHSPRATGAAFPPRSRVGLTTIPVRNPSSCEISIASG
jgi:hypothetical protein